MRKKETQPHVTTWLRPEDSESECEFVKSLSRVRLFVIPWTIAHQAPLSMGFSRQDYWSGWPFLSPGDLPNSGIKPGSPAFQADALLSKLPGKPFLVDSRLGEISQ